MNTTIVPIAKAIAAQSEIRQAALDVFGSSVPENIAHTPQCSNQWPMPVVLDLSSKPVDMNVDYIRVGFDAHPPNVMKNHGPRDDAAGVPAEILQQNEFLGGEIQNLSAA